MVALCRCSNAVPKNDRLITREILTTVYGANVEFANSMDDDDFDIKIPFTRLFLLFFAICPSINSSSGRRSVYYQFYRDFRLNLKNRHIFSIQTARHPDTMLQVDNSATCTARISPSK